MESFHWDKHFETGLQTVDQQHHHLVDLINQFGELLIKGDKLTSGDTETLYAQLADYAQYHFSEEEALMQSVGLDARHMGQHMQSHRDFVQDLTLLHQTAPAHGDSSHGLLKFLTYWLAYHILGADQSMAHQIRSVQAGQTPQHAYDVATMMHKGATEPLLLALNGLFQQVSERNRDLMELNRTLEARVDERTRSLFEANQALQKIALSDVLTGLPNRRQAMTSLSQSWAQSQRDGSPLSCMMIDADDFKQVNDRSGHDAGDEVLRQLSARLRASVRTNDLVCRLGGDEFLIICGGTPLEGALQLAESTRQKVAEMRVDFRESAWLGSISIGVATKIDGLQDGDALLKLADEGLYNAKRQGRNRVGCGNAPPN